MYPDSGGQNSVRCSTVCDGAPPYHEHPFKSGIATMRLVIPLVLVAVVAACATSPTGRRQLILVSNSQMMELGATSFSQMKKELPPAKDAKVVAYVNCVARNVTSVMPPNNWEVQVFEDKNINAFALPGGKIGVFTGLLKAAVNQDQLAAVIGHEVAHVIAN